MNKLNHLAIIVDGNGRWAKSIGKIRSYGHLKGYENLKKIGKDEIWLKKQVEKFNIKPENALIVTFDGKEQIFCQEKERK